MKSQSKVRGFSKIFLTFATNLLQKQKFSNYTLHFLTYAFTVRFFDFVGRTER